MSFFPWSKFEAVGAFAFSPVASSCRQISQTTMTGIAKNDRKNTACPAGTCADVALIIEAMTMNTRTEPSLKAMPRRGRMGAPVWVVP